MKRWDDDVIDEKFFLSKNFLKFKTNLKTF